MVKWLSLVVGIFSFWVVSSYSLLEIQSEGYRGKPSLKRLILDILLIIPFTIIFYLSRRYVPQLEYLTIVILLLISVYLLINYLKKRVRFKYTPRGLRLAIPCFTVGLALIITSTFLTEYHSILVIAVILFGDNLVYLINAIISPFERKRNYNYVKKRSVALRDNAIIKVVITGSYGKTSCKRILTEILKSRYQVIGTLKNYNTPMGLLKSIENHKATIDNRENISKTLLFIGEVGARRKGDVKEMCTLINPTYGIITGVCAQHLKSFGSMENVVSTKEELANYVGINGVMVFNGENRYSLEMSKRFLGKSIVVGDAGQVTLSNLKMNLGGSTFILHTQIGDIPLKTKLIGRHNVVNVALCVALAIELGVDRNEIIDAVEEVDFEPHRLEVKDIFGIVVLDDGYNGNVEGVKSALELLEMEDGRKIIYAQGVVECGKSQKKINKDVGLRLGKVADEVILSGVNAKAIERGLKESGFEGKIHKFSSITHATEGLKHILKQGDILYLQNDIP